MKRICDRADADPQFRAELLATPDNALRAEGITDAEVVSAEYHEQYGTCILVRGAAPPKSDEDAAEHPLDCLEY